MTSKLFAFAALFFVLSACSGEQQEGSKNTCSGDGDCPSGFVCQAGLCEGSSSVNADGGPDGSSSVGDGGVTVRAIVDAVGGPEGVDVDVVIETDGCKGTSKTCDIEPGSDVKFTAPEVPGYRFIGWTGDPRCVPEFDEMITVKNVSANIMCVANYVKRVTVTGETTDTGSVTASSNADFAECDGASCTVDLGQTVVLVAEELSGYRFVGFEGDGCDDVEDLRVTVVAGEANVMCTATYAKSFEVVGSSAGAITPIEVTSDTAFSVCMDGTCVVDEEGSVTLTAPALSGFRFTGWTGDTVCTGTSLTLEIMPVTGNVSCTANYVARFTATGLASGTPTNPAPTADSTDPFKSCTGGVCEVDQGSQVVLSAQTVAGYRLTGFSGEGCTDVAGTTVTLSNLTVNRVCTAQYVQGIAIAGNAVGAAGDVIVSSTSPGFSCTAGQCVLDAGGDVSLTATPIDGYRFTHWSGDPGCTGTTQTITLTNVTVSATCSANYVRRWDVQFADPAGGSVAATTPPAAASCDGDNCIVDEGSALTLVATADGGYRFNGWTNCATSNNAQITLSNITGDLTCVASFTREWTVTYTAGTGGSVSAPTADCPAGSPCTLDQGSDLAIIATPAAGYRFGAWSGAGCTDSATGTASIVDLANISGTITCNASFVRQFSVTYAAGTGGSVSAPAAQCASGSPCTVDQGQSLAVTATAAAGYRFDAWSGTGCTDSVSGTVNVVDLSSIASNVSCTASFVRQWSVTYTAGTGGSVSAPAAQCASGSPCTVDQGENLAITAAAATGYRFGGWAGAGCADSVAGTPEVADLANINRAITCTASFVRQWSVTYSAGTGGSISAPAAQCPSGSPCTVDQGESLAITATATSGYRFSGWSGTGCTDSVAGTANVADLASIGSNVTCSATFMRQWQVSYAAGTGGSVSAPAAQCASGSPCTVDAGDDLDITATPASGYRFGGWSGAGCTDGTPGTVNVVDLLNISAPVTCTASFTRQWPVTYAAGTGGSVSAPAAQCPSGSPCSIDQDGNLAITATPAAGYRFGGWTGAGCVDSATATVNVVDLSNISAAVTCNASFVRQWQVTYAANTGGSVSAPAAQCASGSPCTVDQGASLAVTATPAAGYRFGSWSGAGCTDSVAGTPNVADLASIGSAVQCTASFVRQWAVTYAANPGGSVNAPAAQCPTGSPCTVDQGEDLAITATPAAGYRFGNWSGAGCTDSVAGTVNVVDLSNVGSAVQCTATFVRQWSVTYTAGSGGSVSAPAGQCPSGSPCTLDQGANLAVTATPSGGYRFDSWSGAGCTDSVTGTPNVADLSNISSAVTCTASFVLQGAVTYSASTGGSVSAPAAQCPTGSPCTLDQSESLAITATASAGYRFGNWTGTGCTDSVPSTPLVVDLANVTTGITCTANFVRQWAVTYSAGTGGSVTAPTGQCPSGSPCTLDQGASLDVTATPAAGYRFGAWTGAGCTDSDASTLQVADLANITSAVTCTASFVRQWAVTYSAAAGGTVGAPAAQCPAGSPCTLDQGASLAISAAPASGYRFAGWTGTNCTDSVTSTAEVVDLANLSTAVTCTATFTRQWSVSYAANAGGSVSAPAAQCPAGSPCTVDQGANLAITAAPASGYRFSGWAGTNCTDSVAGTVNVVDLSNIGAAVTCTASFVRQWSVTYSAGTGGSVSAPSAQCAAGSPCTVDQGSSLDVTATPAAGYRFSAWTGTNCDDSVTGTANVVDLVGIDAAVTCTASFVRQWAVTYSAGTGGAVSAPSAQCPSGSPCSVDQGESLAITATPAAGYRFGAWAGTNCADSVAGTVNVVDLSGINAAVTCTASFVRQWAVTYSAGTGGSLTAPAGQCPAGSPCTLDAGSDLDLTATPSAGYRFAGFSGANCTDSATGTPDVMDLVDINAAVTCTASFTRQWSVTYSANAGGQVSAPAGQCPDGSPCTVDQGASLAVTATPAAGYRFSNWTGTNCTDSVAGTVNVVDLSAISAAVTCTANFTRQWQVTYAAGPGGAVSAPAAQCPAGSPCTVDQGADLDITATAATGYRFGGWTGTNCTDSATGTANVMDLAGISAAVTCTASFVPRFTIAAIVGPVAGGSVSATPAGQAACSGASCTVDQDVVVTLLATPSSGAYRFVNWSGANAACTGTTASLALQNVNATCTANFTQRWTIAAVVGTGGGGTVSATPAGQPACTGASCTVDQDVDVTLLATPTSTAYRFVEWTGASAACTGTSPSLTLANVNATCTATFTQRWTIAAVVGPVAGGTVTATPAGQPACSGASCSVDQGVAVTLLATVSSSSFRFVNWTGANAACTGTNASLTLQNTNATCTANFARLWTVTFTGSPTGGTVASTPGATCGAAGANNCVLTVDQGTNVDLTATSASGYRFGSWSCTDADTTTVNVLDLNAVAANFTCNATFVRQWAVTYSANTGGSVSAPAGQCPTGSPCTVDQGANLDITAAPSSGYRFNGWTGAGCTDSDTATATVADLTNISSAITCTASFVRQWAVTYSAGTGGAVSAPAGQCPSGSPCTVDQGDDLAITAAPASGYRFNGWTGTGCTDSVTGTPSVVDLANIGAAITCTASFVRQWTVTFTGAPTGGSVASVPGATCGTSGANNCSVVVDQGTNVDLTAASAVGYRFGSWSCTDGDTTTVNVLDLNAVAADFTCNATFVRQWAVAYSAGTGGSVSAPAGQCPNGSPCTVDQGANLDVTATPAAGYRFNAWTGAGCTDSVAGTANVADLTNIGSAITCTASFTRQFAVTYTANTGGAVSAPAAQCPNGSPCTVDQGTDLAITAAPASGYRFNGWTGTGCTDSVTGTPLVADLADIGTAITCTASFVRQWTVTFTSAPTGGSVTSVPGATCGTSGVNNCSVLVDQGTNVDLTAVNATGYRFGSWSCADADTATVNVLDLNAVAANLTCNATFVRQWAVTYSGGTGGSVSAPAAQCPNGSPCTVDQGANLDVTATPASGYRFNGWTGAGCTDSDPNTANIADLTNIGSAVTCTASFTREWTVTYSAGTGGGVSAPAGQCPSGSPCTVDQGDNLAITAAPASGYRFNGWTGTGCTDSVPTTPNVADLANIGSAITCTASFVRQWTVTFTGAPTGGTVTSVPGATCGAAGANNCSVLVDQGTNVDLTAVNATGYRFGSWSCTDADTSTVNVLDLNAVGANFTCNATFVRQWAVTYSGGTGGTVTAPAGQCPSGSPCTLDQGANLDVTAAPASGYRFNGWTGAGCTDSDTATANIADLTNISSAITCTASFTRQWSVTYSGGTGGTVTAPAAQCPNGSPCGVDQGANLAVTATPASGYRFNGWTGTGCTDSVPTTPNVADLSNISAAITCTASFVRQWTVTFTGAPTGGTVTSVPGATCGAAGANNCSVLVDQGTNVDLTAANATGYRFGSWSCTDADTSTVNVLDLNAVGANFTCNATFVRQWAVTYSGGTGGTVTAPAGQCPSGSPCTVDQGTNLAITATPASGYRFGSWTGTGCTDSVAGTTNVADLASVGSAITCTASFVRQWTITFPQSPGVGSVTPSNYAPSSVCTSDRCDVDNGTAIRLTAAASSVTHRFLNWSGCSTSTNPQLDLANITGNATCTANFVRRWTVSFTGAPTGGTVTSVPGATCGAAGPNNCVVTVDQGTNVDLTATVGGGYRFGAWSCSDADTTTPTVLDLNNVTTDLTCNASFVRQWTVTFTSAPTGGGVTSSPAASCGTSGVNNCVVTVDQGASVDLVASVATGYRFGSWSCTDADTTTPLVLDLNSVSSALTCNASFIRQYRAQGFVSGAPSGSVLIAPCNSSDCTVDANTNVTLTAPLVSGYTFQSWSGTGCSDANPDQNPRTLQYAPLATNLSCTATYRIQRWTITVGSNPSNLGQAQVETPTTGSPSCTADPATGITISCIVDNGTPVIISGNTGNANTRFTAWNGSPGCAATTARHTVTVTADTTCAAQYYGLWSRSINAGGQLTDLGYSALVDPKGELVVAGSMSPGSLRGWLGQLEQNSGAVLSHGGYTDAGNIMMGYGLATNNDGFAMSAVTQLGQIYRPVVLGFNRERTLTWAREIPTDDQFNDYLNRATYLPQYGTYVAAGYVEGNSDLRGWGHIAGVTADSGLVRFNRRFCMTDPRSCSQRPTCLTTQGMDVVPTDEGFAVVSQAMVTTQSPNVGFALLTFFDREGNTLDEYYYYRTLNGDQHHDLIPSSVTRTPDGNYLITGRTKDYSPAGAATYADGFAMKVRPDGSIVWDTRIGSEGLEEIFVRATVSLDDSELLLTGYGTGSNQNLDGWFVRLDKDGNVFPDNPETRINERGDIFYHLGGVEALYDIVPMLDGGYAMTGLRYNPTADPGTAYDLWALRVDHGGTINFNAASGGTRTIASHAQVKLEALGPFKTECRINQDRFTEGSDRLEPVEKYSTPFTVNQASQAP